MPFISIRLDIRLPLVVPRPYLDSIGPILVSPIGPRNHLVYPTFQPDTYKVHFRGLYGQPRLNKAKDVIF